MQEVESIMLPGFYNMDCMDALKQFPDKFFGLAIVDPPYGIMVANHECGKIVGGGAAFIRRKGDAQCMGQAQKRKRV